ncbi:MAG: histidine utilization repressor [Hyphomicrobiales bacterium]
MSTHKANRVRHSQSLHDRILNDIQGHIVSGRWAPGHRIPFETDLAAQYGCSRMTANKVLTQLSRAGLLERKRKLGTFVKTPQAQSAVLEIHDIEREIKTLGLDYGFRLFSRDLRDANVEDMQRLSLTSSNPILALSCIHMASQRPFCLEERLINLKAVPEALEADFNVNPPGGWLLKRVPWIEAEHTISAIASSNDEAQHLAVEVGTPCLVVERRTRNNERNVTWARLTYPGPQHKLIAQFTPSIS